MAGESNTTVALLAASGLLSLLAFVTGGTLGIITGAMILIALIAAPISFILYKWGYWMVPYFTKGQRTIQSEEAVVDIQPTEDVIVKREGGSYYATMFVVVKLFKSVTNMSDDEKIGFMDLWERAISAMKMVTKYSVLVYLKDLSKYKEGIEGRKAKAQMEISREQDKPNPERAKLDRLEREIAMWDGMAARLDVGDKPSAILTYIQVSAKGATKDAATAAVRQSVNEIRTTIATALNVEVAPLTGEDMKRCFDWEFAMPPGLKEL